MFALWIDDDQRFAFSESDNGGLNISNSAYVDLIAGQSDGRQIGRDNTGQPTLIDPPPPSIEMLAVAVRADRDARLLATQWLVERHNEQEATNAATLSQSQYSILLQYRQALRDVPAQCGFPVEINWPAPPDFVKDATF
ncbi:phage tail protein [Chromobacterium vaccinii]|nr:phage tail protein [Chromobacterium vaccinii]